MNAAKEMLLLSQEDLLSANCLDFKAAVEVCRQALVAYSEGDVIAPEKVSVIFDERTQDRINCLPAGFRSAKTYGMKWVSVFPENPRVRGIQNVGALSLLSSMEDGNPLALMDSTMLSGLRTAAMSALAARYLAKAQPRRLAFIGAGVQARMHFLAMTTEFPSISSCAVASRTSATEREFARQMSARTADVDIVPMGGDYEAAVRDADMIVTAISGQERILQPRWISPGAFYAHVGGLEDDYGVPKKAAKIVCDSWAGAKHRSQTISRMYHEGLLRDSDIYAELHEIVTGSRLGRENDEEFIYYNGVGLAFVDVAIARWALERARVQGVGHRFTLQEKPLFG